MLLHRSNVQAPIVILEDGDTTTLENALTVNASTLRNKRVVISGELATNSFIALVADVQSGTDQYDELEFLVENLTGTTITIEHSTDGATKAVLDSSQAIIGSGTITRVVFEVDSAATGGIDVSTTSSSYPIEFFARSDMDVLIATDDVADDAITEDKLADAVVTKLDLKAYKGAWAQNTSYEAGDIVTNGGNAYIAPADLTSGATFDPTNWTQISGDDAEITDGSIDTDQLAAGAVTEAKLATNVARKLNLKAFRGNWAASTSYNAGDIILNNNHVYLADADVTSSLSFDPENWLQLSNDEVAALADGSIDTDHLAAGAVTEVKLATAVATKLNASKTFVGDWTTATAYIAGSITQDTNNFYIAVSNHTSAAGNKPTASGQTTWLQINNQAITQIADTTIYKGEHAAGEYKEGDIVKNGTHFYIAVTSFTATATFEPGNWAAITITDGSVDTDQLAAGAVTEAKLDSGVTTKLNRTLSIGAGTISATELAANSVTTGKINNNAVTNAKLADNSVDSDQYVDGSIDEAHFADDAVSERVLSDAIVAKLNASKTFVGAWALNSAYGLGSIVRDTDFYIAVSAHTSDADNRPTADGQTAWFKINNVLFSIDDIASASITNDKLADNSVDSDQYVDGSIDSVHISSGAITNGKIADTTIARGKLSQELQDSIGTAGDGDASTHFTQVSMASSQNLVVRSEGDTITADSAVEVDSTALTSKNIVLSGDASAAIRIVLDTQTSSSQYDGLNFIVQNQTTKNITEIYSSSDGSAGDEDLSAALSSPVLPGDTAIIMLSEDNANTNNVGVAVFTFVLYPDGSIAESKLDTTLSDKINYDNIKTWVGNNTYRKGDFVVFEGNTYLAPTFITSGVTFDPTAWTLLTLADGAVSTDKITNGAVTTAKIGAGVVTTGKIMNSGITTVKINDSAVTEDKINNSAVTADKINNAAVTESKLADSAVTNTKINDTAVTEAKLHPDVQAKLNASGFTVNGQTAKTTLADNDAIAISDSADTNNNKKVSWSAIKEEIEDWLAGSSPGVNGVIRSGSGIAITRDDASGTITLGATLTTLPDAVTSGQTIYAAIRENNAEFTATDFTGGATSDTDQITIPTWGDGNRYLGFAIPATADDLEEWIEVGSPFNEIDNLEKQTDALDITSVSHVIYTYVNDDGDAEPLYQINSGDTYILR